MNKEKDKDKDKEKEIDPLAYERRRSPRIKKSFILSYHDKKDPLNRFDTTQLKNISLGGMCFVTNQYFSKGTTLTVELKTPYLAGTTFLEGEVLACHEKVPNIIFDTRLKFEKISPQAEFILNKIIDLFKEGKHNFNE